MNVSSISTICITSLTTATLGLSFVQAMNFAAPKALIPTLTGENRVSEKANLHQQKFHLLLFSYEPPPNIGGPKRTGGSGGRYV